MIKSIFIIMFCVVIIVFLCCAYSIDYNNNNFDSDYFIFLESNGNMIFNGETFDLITVYAKDNGVKYLVGDAYNGTIITPLYNPDGSLQVYEGK